jgi:hypothetical protein
MPDYSRCWVTKLFELRACVHTIDRRIREEMKRSL